MKFRRKSESAEAAEPSETAEVDGVEAAQSDVGPVAGPYDVDDLAADDAVTRLDLGSLLVEPVEGLELRLQVDEADPAGPGGAARRARRCGRAARLRRTAPRRPVERDPARDRRRVRPARRHRHRAGGQVTAPSSFCQLTVRTDDGRTGTQASRVVGVNGARWMLRATFLGRPAVDPDAAELWEQAVEKLVVRRGTQAMPVGAELTLTLPAHDHVVVHED